ncbi:NAD(P)/FAD-dependent oxidoreductase [Agriterribacter sp.]|uniref:NAD(P)/FAD-dependent oxidoreductase n=1 Tax=Agriterribacter sp. TaxID=2821509 RepID=UPI002CD417DC|nr:NAD(P)/FAD-dependent oxidoreductase [Agriterribacter sp.]HRO44478.1 NAD(P)/FAD-dependent oxidoreductase [Agriterribacter sp.]HRQ16496.1 NAD(P)/FAD-dependent oxidoreductase [Agriterribacter sp.]
MATAFALPLSFNPLLNKNKMIDKKHFDVIIIGGSYSGLAAAMALGRALRKVLVIDSGKPCNRQTPHSHNFLTQDGKTPKEIATLAKKQVSMYDTVEFLDDLATNASKTVNGFEIQTSSEYIFTAAKLIFATGIKDEMPNIKGLSECWGISVLHCPYCHGYEVRNQTTGILGNGEYGFEFSRLISNWTKELTLFTNGKSALTTEQAATLKRHGIKTEEKEIKEFEHINGQLQNIVFKDGSKKTVKAIYTRLPFEQHCPIPEQLGCELTEDGYIRIDHSPKTTIKGIYACGDNVSRIRTVANAVSMGATTGMMVNKELIEEKFINKK